MNGLVMYTYTSYRNKNSVSCAWSSIVQVTDPPPHFANRPLLSGSATFSFLIACRPYSKV